MTKSPTIIFVLLIFIICSTAEGQKLKEVNFKPTVKNGVFVNTLESVNEHLSGILSQRWIPNEWHDIGRILYEYNESGNITLMNMDSLHNSEWVTIMSMTAEYDGNKPITDIFRIYEVDGTQEWATKNVTSYNGDKPNESIQYAWDEDANDWILQAKFVYEYSNDLVSKIIDYSWNEIVNEWEPFSENIMTYDGQNREIEGISKNWNADEQAFVNSGKTITEYYKDLLISRMETVSWNHDANVWSEDYDNLMVNQYNGNDKIIESVYTTKWGFGDFSFVFKDSTIYEYDGNNYLIVETDFNWQQYVGYQEFLRVEYTNDSQGNVLEDINYTYSGGNWVPYEKHIYNYEGVVDVNYGLAIPTTFMLEQNYPNPFNPTTEIKYSVSEHAHVEINVYDMLGNFIKALTNKMHTPGNYSVRFNATDLASGTYIYVLKSDIAKVTKKCLLLK